MITRPPQITDHHLRRRAVVYIRQSSPEQVRENVGSAAVQRDLVRKLEAWGWAPEMVDVLDEDLGMSGSRPGAREAFNQLLDQMKAGVIGLIAVVDSSRLSRNIHDLFRFVDAAQRHHVLLAQSDQIIDFNDPNSLFIGGILGLNAIRENQARILFSVQARRKKAEAGIAPTASPVGYVRRPDGAWLKDPDPHVREVITLVFDKFLEIGSIRGVLRHLRTHQIRVPRRRWRDRDRWQDATYSHIAAFLKNPVYAGRYIYGQTLQESPAEGSCKRGRQRPRPVTEWIIIEQHHEPYVNPARWPEIQQQIAANRWPVRPPAGRGEALVQGLLRCSLHHTTFQTVYGDRYRHTDGRVERRARYICRPGRETANPLEHQSVMAARVDAVVERLLLETLTPVSLDGIQEAVRQELRHHEALERGRQDELRRAQQAAAEAERGYLQADPAHVHAKKRLAERFDQAIRELENLQAHHRLHPLVPPLTPDDATLAELRQILSDLPRLWRHPSVTPEQRKAIVRAVIKFIHVSPASDTWTLEIEWVSGMQTPVPLTRQNRAPARPASYSAHKLIDPAAYPFIRERAALGMTVPAIVEALNAAGFRHPRRVWRPQSVNWAIARLRRGEVPGVEPLPAPPTLTDHVRRLHHQGYSPAEMVAQLQAQGVRTRHRTPVTLDVVYKALERLELSAHSVLTDQRVCAQLREWGPSATAAEVARRLNALGLTTKAGRPWTPENVREKLRGLRLAFVRLRRLSRPAPQAETGDSDSRPSDSKATPP